MLSISELIKEKNVYLLKNVLRPLSAFEIVELLEDKSEDDHLFVFSLLHPKLAAATFEYFTPRVQKYILHSLSHMQTATILDEMSPDDRTALLEELPRAVVKEYVALLSEEERLVALKLLGYPEDSVGRLMTPDYISVKMDWTVEQALDRIREYGHDSETVNVVYIVDDNNVLLDDIKIKEFLFAAKQAKIDQITDKRFVSLSVLDDLEKAFQVFKEHDRVALPVVDDKGVLQGIVTVDDILRILSEKSTEEMQKVGGTEALDEPYMETPFFHLMLKRVRWLVLLFLGEMFTATAMGYFEGEISKAVVLALFLPLIISSGGNAGSQSSTLIIRALALGEVHVKDWARIMKRELFSGLFLGFILGCIGFLRVSLFSAFSDIYGEHWALIALTIFLALIGVVLWGSVAGSFLPLILRRVGWDPATASAPLVATLVDVTGIVIYFCIALFILKGALL